MFSMRFILVVSAALVLHLVMALGFMVCRSSALRGYHDQVRDWEKDWETEDYDRETAQAEELKVEYGAGPLELLAYDPRLDIQTVLRKLFQAATPNTYVVEVGVDRFTEFSIAINVFNMPDKKILAGYLQEVFSRVDPAPVYQVVFYTTTENNYLVVDQARLRAVRDWKGMSKEEIAKICF
jgi:hypothetical protein